MSKVKSEGIEKKQTMGTRIKMLWQSLNKNFNLSMYITNIVLHEKYMRTVLTHELVCIRNLTRSLSSPVGFLILHQLVRKYRNHTLSMTSSMYVSVDLFSCITSWKSFSVFQTLLHKALSRSLFS